MSLLERVQKLLDEKGLSIKQAERESGLSNATIRKWDTQNPSLDSIVKLANYLQVSVDYLAQGKEVCAPSRFEVYCDGLPLSETEADLVAMYRVLGDSQKETAFDFVTLLYEKETGERGSVYLTYTDTNEQQENDPVSGVKPTREIV
jgi:transcriptional regulator with XRE-family HTH domain